MLTLLLIAASPAQASAMGPDGHGYSFADSFAPDGPAYDFVDVKAANATSLGKLGDSGVANVTLPFPFTFYGETYENVYVAADGFLTFEPLSYYCCSARKLPAADSTNAVVAAYWADLLAPADTVVHATLGEPGARVFVVQYEGVRHYSYADRLSFEVKLFEADDSIEVHWRSAVSDGRYHSAGIENQDGTIALQYEYSSFSRTEAAVRYTLADEFNTTPLPPPSGQATRGPGAGNITVTWIAPPGVDGFRVYRSDYYYYSSWSLAGEVSGNTSSFLDSGLADDTTYYYYLTTLDEGNESAPSSMFWGSTIGRPGSVYPSAAPGEGNGEINVTWNAPEDDGGSPILGYRLTRYSSSCCGPAEMTVQLGADVRSYLDQGLADGTSYSYRVVAVNAYGAGHSSAATARTYSAPGAPGQPAAALDPLEGTTTLQWKPALAEEARPVLNYTLVRRDATGAEERIEVGNATTYVDREANLGSVVSYRVYATNGVGPGPHSSETISPGVGPGFFGEREPSDNLSETTLLAQRISLEDTPLGEGFVVARASPDADDSRYYTVELSVAGQSLPALSLYSAGAATTEFDSAQSWLQVTVVQSGDDGRVTCLARVGDACVLSVPAEPADVGWLSANGAESALSVEVALVVNGQTVAAETVRAPFVGQLLAG